MPNMHFSILHTICICSRYTLYMNQIVAKFTQKYKWQIYQTTTTKLKPLNSKQRGIGLNLTKKTFMLLAIIFFTSLNVFNPFFKEITPGEQKNWWRLPKVCHLHQVLMTFLKDWVCSFFWQHQSLALSIIWKVESSHKLSEV